MVLGLGTAVLAFFLGRALFSRAVGLALAAFCATYWVFVYFEGELHAPVLISALQSRDALGAHAVGKTAQRSRAPSWPGCSSARRARPVDDSALRSGGRGLDGLCRKKLGARSKRDALAFLAAAIFAVAPATIRNWVVAKDFVLISSNGAINFFIGNNQEADGVGAHSGSSGNGLDERMELVLLRSHRRRHVLRMKAGRSSIRKRRGSSRRRRSISFAKTPRDLPSSVQARRAVLGPCGNRQQPGDPGGQGSELHAQAVTGIPWALSLSSLGRSAPF